MSIEDNIFKKHKPDFEKLIKYGFKKSKTNYTTEKLFKDGEFKAIITISKSGKVTGTVIDLESNDEFLPLRVENLQGAFVGEVREEYSKILTDIKNNCFDETYFISNQGNRITKELISKYNDMPAFMWEKTPECGVFKNSENGKWYGIIMQIPRSKLGEPDSAQVEIINIKLDKDKITELHKKDGFYPAWHMNKKYWITITLDETLTDKEILTLIDESYSYTMGKRKSQKKHR